MSARERLIELLREHRARTFMVQNIVEACAAVADSWTHSTTCRPDEEVCDHMRTGEGIAHTIRACLKEATNAR